MRLLNKLDEEDFMCVLKSKSEEVFIVSMNVMESSSVELEALYPPSS